MADSNSNALLPTHTDTAMQAVLDEIQDKAKSWSFCEDWTPFVQHWTYRENQNPDSPTYPYPFDTKTSRLVVVLQAMYGRLIVTKSYADMYKRIQLGLCLSDQTTQPDGTTIVRPATTKEGVLITGQPGTGKSVFLWYFATRILQDYPMEPLLIIQPGEPALLFVKGYAFQCEGTNLVLPNMSRFSKRAPSADYPPYESCLTLVECNSETFPDILLKGSVLPIFASSPKENRFATFLKVKRPFIWGMPTWNKKELRLGFRLHGGFPAVINYLTVSPLPTTKNELPYREGESSDDDIDDIDTGKDSLAQLVDVAVREVGWAPRDVFEYMAAVSQQNQGELIEAAQGAILKMDHQAMRTAITDFIGTAASNRSDLSHKVCTAHAVPQLAKDTKHSRFVISFKTRFIEGLFLQRFQSLAWADLIELLQITQAVPAARALEGNIFESVAHRLLPDQKNIELRIMKEQSRTDRGVTYVNTDKPTVFVDFCRNVSLPFGPSPPPNIQTSAYYEASHNTPLVDGFVIEAKTGVVHLYFIQLSVSQKKGNLAPGGLPLVNAIVEMVRKIFPHPHVVVTNFVLVHPADSKSIPSWRLPPSIDANIYWYPLMIPRRNSAGEE
ncbi:hypothetical protein DFJ43DRAFT_1098322 [Lentinula guzmanii]|uniref:Uncharacterized protein n=1 Tax=Lentinula guzmanii TaxID=2804957 RepID=A0AA38J4T1_9AGAR|nr:hypothetical protein DFJ43DRAFT_1098322 [Lentinula guzmanii]